VEISKGYEIYDIEDVAQIRERISAFLAA